MNVLLVNVPSRKGKAGFMLPLGLLYVGAIIERSGHRAKIVDLYLNDIDFLYRTIEEFNPAIIGFGGIATSYGQTKRLSLQIKERYPQILQIAGGALASTYELLLTKTKIDVVFHGETEVSLPLFLAGFDRGSLPLGVPGISYLSNGKIVKNPPPEQIKNIDEIPLPAYHLVDVKLYLHPVKDFVDSYSMLLNSNPTYRDLLKKSEIKLIIFLSLALEDAPTDVSFATGTFLGIGNIV